MIKVGELAQLRVKFLVNVTGYTEKGVSFKAFNIDSSIAPKVLTPISNDIITGSIAVNENNGAWFVNTYPLAKGKSVDVATSLYILK